MSEAAQWPRLTYHPHKAALETLQLWTQIVGKFRLAQTPWLNHSWHVPLYVTVRGLGTRLIPYNDGRSFELEFDFTHHRLLIATTEDEHEEVGLRPRTVADFYAEVKQAMSRRWLDVRINELPNEVMEPIPFPEDTIHGAYDAEYANSLWLALVQIDRVLNAFRTGFVGKASPVHFFWGSFDLAVTRFSGRRAPTHPGGVPNLPDEVTREAYSHEVSSAGFWPGGGGVEEPMFYSYAYPVPESFGSQEVEPEAAWFHPDLGEFVLPYEAVRSATDPDSVLLAFLKSTYEGAASLSHWDREALECPLGRPRRPRVV